MLLHIVARGRIGRSAEAELVDRYLKRLSWPTRVTELPDQGGKVPPVEPHTRIVMLDEKGETLASTAFAEKLGRWRDDGVRETRFLIGAADGFDQLAGFTGGGDVGVEIDENSVALTGEGETDASADAAGTAGDECYFLHAESASATEDTENTKECGGHSATDDTDGHG